MKILWYTDTHFGYSGAFSRPSSSGYTTRLDDTLELHRWIATQVKEHQPDLAINGGDIYKPQINLHGLEVSASIRGTNQVIKASPMHITLLGNHDYIGRDTRVTAIDWLNELPKSKLIKTIDYMDFPEKDPDLALVFCPYVWDYDFAVKRMKELLKDRDFKKVYYFGHAEIRGALNSVVLDLGTGEHKEHKATSANAVPVEFLSEFTMAFNGHHHIPQRPEPNVYLTGSTQQFTVTEYAPEEKRGVYLIDTDKATVQVIENRITPEIVRVEKNKDRLSDLPDNTYVIYYYDASQDTPESLQPLLSRFKGHKLRMIGSDKFKPITAVDFESQDEDHIGIYEEYLNTVAFDTKELQESVEKSGKALIKKAQTQEG